MPVIAYDYAVVAGRRSPLIPLGLGYQGQWQRIEAYVDSGAFYSVFKPDVCSPGRRGWGHNGLHRWHDETIPFHCSSLARHSTRDH